MTNHDRSGNLRVDKGNPSQDEIIQNWYCVCFGVIHGIGVCFM
jgi:hypothetical protein